MLRVPPPITDTVRNMVLVQSKTTRTSTNSAGWKEETIKTANFSSPEFTYLYVYIANRFPGELAYAGGQN